MGHIYKRGRIYWIKYYRNGKPYRESTRSKKEADAKRLLKRRDGSGRIAALEIMIGTPAIRNLIREHKVSQIPSIMQTGQKFGMQTMEAVLKDMINRKLIAPEEAEGLIDETLNG